MAVYRAVDSTNAPIVFVFGEKKIETNKRKMTKKQNTQRIYVRAARKKNTLIRNRKYN